MSKIFTVRKYVSHPNFCSVPPMLYSGHSICLLVTVSQEEFKRLLIAIQFSHNYSNCLLMKFKRLCTKDWPHYYCTYALKTKSSKATLCCTNVCFLHVHTVYAHANTQGYIFIVWYYPILISCLPPLLAPKPIHT